MVRPSKLRHYIIYSQAKAAAQIAREQAERENAQLLDDYLVEVLTLREALNRVSSLPEELNNWYGKYAAIRSKYEESLRQIEGYKEQNIALARRLEKVQVSWRSLENILQ
ncbi:4567_t:CDS:1 [Funneliformis caledonium]|uniref:4567_t:CDS:1 n=1 Tax=Funneliformis caledonium TaxID=1117310 RepID=A0A9N9BIL8_9GLOM|nr:4567_t:CDS:1 [Funneliformis caledonium]